MKFHYTLSIIFSRNQINFQFSGSFVTFKQFCSYEMRQTIYMPEI